MSSAQKPKSRLGRGLASLISVSDLPAEAEVHAAPATSSIDATRPAPESGSEGSAVPTPLPNSGPLEIPVASIDPNPHQPRKQFDEAGILSLAASIKSSGLVQPVVVRKIPGDEQRYELIAGERRLRAAKAANLISIPALIRDVDPFRQAQMALVENIQREDLNPLDRAEAYQALMNQLGLTQSELANRLGEDRSTVTHYLRLLNLVDVVREMVKSGQLTLGHAKLLAGVPDPNDQEHFAGLAINQELSVRNLERAIEISALRGELTPPPTAKEPASPHIRDLEKTITSQLGLRVQLRASSTKGKGKVIIHYSDLDQFDRLLERLKVKSDQ